MTSQNDTAPDPRDEATNPDPSSGLIARAERASGKGSTVDTDPTFLPNSGNLRAANVTSNFGNGNETSPPGIDSLLEGIQGKPRAAAPLRTPETAGQNAAAYATTMEPKKARHENTGVDAPAVIIATTSPIPQALPLSKTPSDPPPPVRGAGSNNPPAPRLPMTNEDVAAMRAAANSRSGLADARGGPTIPSMRMMARSAAAAELTIPGIRQQENRRRKLVGIVGLVVGVCGIGALVGLWSSGSNEVSASATSAASAKVTTTAASVETPPMATASAVAPAADTSATPTVGEPAAPAQKATAPFNADAVPSAADVAAVAAAPAAPASGAVANGAAVAAGATGSGDTRGAAGASGEGTSRPAGGRASGNAKRAPSQGAAGTGGTTSGASSPSSPGAPTPSSPSNASRPMSDSTPRSDFSRSQ